MTGTKDLIVNNVCKSYDGEPILDHLTLTFSFGKTYCLMAPSGFGKTTFFRLLMGLEALDSGSVIGMENCRLATVFQEDRLLESYTAMENLRFVTGRRYSAAALSSILLRLLPEEALKKPVREFSGGMKRRTAILRALLAPSDILIMDEPFTGLDSETKAAAAALIKEYTTGKIVLFSTHNVEDAVLLDAEVVQLQSQQIP